MNIKKINQLKYFKFLIFFCVLILFLWQNNNIEAMLNQESTSYDNKKHYSLLRQDTKIYNKFLKTSNAKANIIITHGIGESSEEYIKLAETLTSSGYNAFIYDLRSHGRSYNKKNTAYVDNYNIFLEDLNSIISYIKKNNDLKIILLGHSLGGMINNSYVLKYDEDKIVGVINSSSPTKIINEVKDFLDEKKIKKMNDIPVSSYEIFSRIPLNEEFKQYRISFVTPKFVKTTMIDSIQYFEKELEKRSFYYPKPILLLHGIKDLIISYDNSVEMFNKITNSTSDKKLILYPESYHNLFNDLDQNEVTKDVLNWLDVIFCNK
ncbi:alpha/beta fold hydrolase [Candidatus Phytoplasma sacchari]|uniref:Alpha/beta fold hydrolase n=1 Tax=Candidatus Phytoplasma sacchari TaxID=2609813 RepID=A0ABY7M2G0_9MOLU|nr:alpha/beta fold hydrolase [Candidatus Phytoplasma sacchari]